MSFLHAMGSHEHRMKNRFCGIKVVVCHGGPEPTRGSLLGISSARRAPNSGGPWEEKRWGCFQRLGVCPELGCSFLTDTTTLCLVADMLWLMESQEKVMGRVGEVTEDGNSPGLLQALWAMQIRQNSDSGGGFSDFDSSVEAPVTAPQSSFWWRQKEKKKYWKRNSFPLWRNRKSFIQQLLTNKNIQYTWVHYVSDTEDFTSLVLLKPHDAPMKALVLLPCDKKEEMWQKQDSSPGSLP